MPVATTYESPADLAAALRRAADAHGRHAAEIGHSDPDWSDCHAQYLVQEHGGGSIEGGPGART